MHYADQPFLPLEDGLLGFVGAAEQLPARELRQGYVKLELIDNLLEFFVDVLELAVPQLG